MITVANPNSEAKLYAKILFNPGINLMCKINAYTNTVTNAQVSFASQPQYLPQDSFAQTPPR
jgi:hypothetical protein